MKRQLILLALACLAPALVAAQTNRTNACTQGSLMRRVEVVYTTSAEVPCEVRYTKEDGSTQVLWRAATQKGYCEMQARDFVAKLQGLGWTCTDEGTSPKAAVPGRAAIPSELRAQR
jgi:hypothetical protein